jgi:diguanylate cyclase (GGDEF)-like protein/PAS domain S-box-containing protein
MLSPIADWPGYLLSALFAGIVHSVFADQPVINSLLLTATTILEACTGAWLTRRINAAPGKFNTPRHVFNLIVFAALVSTAISATLNTTVLATLLPGVSYGATWRLNWVSHILGVIVAAPLLLTWADFRFSALQKSNPDHLIELAILITGLAVCSLYISIGTYNVNQQNYLVVPFLVWAAIRFGPRGTASAALIFTLIFTWGTIEHIEGFAINDATIDPTMQGLGIFLLINLVTCFIITTMWEQSKEIRRAQNESEIRYRLLVENQGEGMGVVDENETFTFANPAAAQILGIEPGKLVGRNLREFTSPQQFDLVSAQTALRKENKRTTYDLEITQPNGRRCNLLITATPQFAENEQFTGTFAVFHDHTERKQVELTLRDSRARYQALFDHSPIPIWEEDFSRIKRLIDGFRREGTADFRDFFTNNPDQLRACEQLIRILDVNKAAMQMFDFTEKVDFMAQVNKMVHRGPYDIVFEEMIAIAEGRTEFRMEGPNDLIDGVVRYHAVRWTVAPGYEQDYRRVIVSIMDVTERIQAEEKLRYLSTHDVLTGLYNRNFFEAEMERLQNSRIEPTNLMMVDVNGMKSTNDTFGHAAGDELLRRTAQVLKLSFRKEDIIARIGGDEFVVLFQGSIPLAEAVSRVQECLEDHNHWYHGPPLSLAIGTASGIKGSPLIELFKKADQLMYKEKMRTRKTQPDNGKTTA